MPSIEKQMMVSKFQNYKINQMRNLGLFSLKKHPKCNLQEPRTFIFPYELASAKKLDVCSKSIQVLCIAHNSIFKNCLVRVCVVVFKERERNMCRERGNKNKGNSFLLFHFYDTNSLQVRQRWTALKRDPFNSAIIFFKNDGQTQLIWDDNDSVN